MGIEGDGVNPRRGEERCPECGFEPDATRHYCKTCGALTESEPQGWCSTGPYILCGYCGQWDKTKRDEVNPRVLWCRHCDRTIGVDVRDREREALRFETDPETGISAAFVNPDSLEER